MPKHTIPLEKRLTKKEADKMIVVLKWEDEQPGTLEDFFGEGDPHLIVNGFKHDDKVYDIAFDFGFENRGVLFQRMDDPERTVEIIPLKALRVINPKMYELYHNAETAQRKYYRKKRNEGTQEVKG